MLSTEGGEYKYVCLWAEAHFCWQVTDLEKAEDEMLAFQWLLYRAIQKAAVSIAFPTDIAHDHVTTSALGVMWNEWITLRGHFFMN